MVSHENIDVSRFDMLVRPNDRMISHLGRTVRAIGAFIDTSEHVHVLAWGLAPGVPLLIVDRERTRKILHYRMAGRFDIYGGGCEARNVPGKADAAHELRKPGPHGESVEFSKECSVVETDPTDGAIFNRLGKGSSSRGSPVVVWIVDLNEKLVLRQVGCVNGFRVFDVVDAEVVDRGLFFQPKLGGIDKGLMQSAALGNREYPKSGDGALCRN